MLWKLLKVVKFGEMISYQQLAALAGNPKAARAVGGAMRNNPVSSHQRGCQVGHSRWGASALCSGATCQILTEVCFRGSLGCGVGRKGRICDGASRRGVGTTGSPLHPIFGEGGREAFPYATESPFDASEPREPLVTGHRGGRSLEKG